MNKLVRLSILLSVFGLAACAGPNPNPGERTVDIAWTSGKFDQAYADVEPPALRGEPWAQLRIAIFLENGWGVEQDLDKAEEYYKKAIVQRGDDEWSKGLMVGTFGPSGYFNQNSDAIIAEYNLANLLYTREPPKQDLVNAYFHISKVVVDSDGNDIFFCCEFNGGRGFTYQMFLDLQETIKSEMSEAQISEAMGLINKSVQ